MAAVIAPQHQPDLAPRRRPTRPSLRLLEGGRRPGDPWVPGPRPVRHVGRPSAPRPIPARVYRQRRIAALVAVAVVAGVVALAVVGATTLLGGAASPATAAAEAPAAAPTAEPQVWVVQPGDTLWSIAGELQPDGDVRPLVDALADRAGDAGLQAGQRIPLDGLPA